MSWILRNYRHVVADGGIFSPSAEDSIIGVDASSAGLTIHLPHPKGAQIEPGQVFIIQDESGSAGGSRKIEVDCPGVSVHGPAQILTPFSRLTFYTDGARWFGA